MTGNKYVELSQLPMEQQPLVVVLSFQYAREIKCISRLILFLLELHPF